MSLFIFFLSVFLDRQVLHRKSETIVARLIVLSNIGFVLIILDYSTCIISCHYSIHAKGERSGDLSATANRLPAISV